jgi:ribosomal protein S21
MAIEKLSPRQAARKRISAAKKALAAGVKGASAKLDKAITAFAKAACKVRTTPGTKMKTSYATISGTKKRKPATKRKTTTKRKRK